MRRSRGRGHTTLLHSACVEGWDVVADERCDALLVVEFLGEGKHVSAHGLHVAVFPRYQVVGRSAHVCLVHDGAEVCASLDWPGRVPPIVDIRRSGCGVALDALSDRQLMGSGVGSPGFVGNGRSAGPSVEVLVSHLRCELGHAGVKPAHHRLRPLRRVNDERPHGLGTQ